MVVLLKEKVNKSLFLRNVAVLVGGTAFGQIILVLASPILTRLYSPDDLGTLSLYLTFVNMAVIAASLRYESAIVATRNDQEAAYLTCVSFLLTLIISPLLAVLLFLMIRLSWLGFGTLPEQVVLLAVPSLFLTAIFAILRYWLIRKGDFKIVSSVTVFQYGSKSVAQIGLGLIHTGWLGLILGEIVGRGSGITRMAKSSWPEVISLVRPFHWRYAFTLLKQYWKFPVYSLPSTFLNNLGAYIMVPLLVVYYGTEAAGYYGLVLRTIALPVALVGSSIGDVFLNRIAEYMREDPARVRPFFLKTARSLLLLSLLPASLLLVFGPQLYSLVFGSNWLVAGQMAQIFSFWVVGKITVGSLSQLVFVLQGQEGKFVYDIVNLVTSVIVFPLSKHFNWSLIEAMWVFTLGNVLSYGVYFFILWRIVVKVTPNLIDDALKTRLRNV